jgi:hypothetical protein
VFIIMLAARPLATLHVRWLLFSLATVALSACGGGGGDNTTPPPSGTTVTISGKITFDRIPFKATLNTGLDPLNPVESPARGVVVEVLDTSSNTVLASTNTDAAGDYTAQVAASRTVKIRAKAQMLKTGTAPTWNFRVVNNTNSDALYALDGTSFDSGTVNSTRNLRATSGWGTTSYTGTRAAAPFAILDTVYRAKELLLTASAAAAFPALDLYWSPTNRTTGTFCPDMGNIGTSFYIVAGSFDDCAQAAVPAGIYILGDLAGGNGDTDEFDQHVIAHEFGHYVENAFSRSDSIGGEHGSGNLLDLRVAFSEGWGNAYSGMTLNDPAYRDSSGTTSDGGLNMETDGTLAEGWYSEASVGEVLWDIFDAANEPRDTVALGFAPIFTVMTGGLKSTDALTSIFTFAAAVRSANPAASAGIRDLLTDEFIFGTDAFAASETTTGGDAGALPVYPDITFGPPTLVCVSDQFGSGNKLGNSRFFRFINPTQRIIVVTAQGATGGAGTTTAVDPDIYVYRQGATAVSGISETVGTEQTQQTSLAAGTYIIEVLDFQLVSGSGRRCMTVAVTGS